MSIIKTEKTVKITLDLPTRIAEFIKDSWPTNDLGKTITKEMVELCISQIEADANAEAIRPEQLIKKYGLFSVFKQYGVIQSYYSEALMK